MPAGDHVRVALTLGADMLQVQIEAPFYSDKAPSAPPGSVPGLWDYEVVELFLLGDKERYLEIELGPHGHHLVLDLQGRRNVLRQGLLLDYEATIIGGRWRGVANVPRALLPVGLTRCNAYAIHGEGPSRVYLAMAPVPGAAPDFHRLEHFVPLVWRLSDAP